MLGREAEQRQLEQLLAEPADWPAGLALEGAAGIGKSTLWRRTLALARDGGVQVIETAPSEPDRGLAFAALGDLFYSLSADALGALPHPQRSAVSAALCLEDAQPGSNPEALARGVLGILRGLAAAAPLLIAIDDEQWLDRPTARVLAFALCRLRDDPIGVLLSRRPESDSALWPELERGFAGIGVETLVVGPLASGELGRLVTTRFGQPIARVRLRRICDASGGNPLYALAIASGLERRGVTSGGLDLPIPDSLTLAMADRLDRLDPRAADPLLVAAMVSRPTLALLSAVLPEFARGDLDGAEQAGVAEVTADRVRFTHPLLAATHYAGSQPARRRELHRRLAEVLDDEEQRAYHLARGAEAADLEIAARIEIAGRAAAGRGAPDTGGELLEHASRLTPATDSGARWSRLITAAQMHVASGDITRARELLQDVVSELPHGSSRARALLELAQVRSDDLVAARSLFEQALGEAGDHHRLRMEIEIAFANLLGGRAEFEEELTHARSAVEAAKRTNEPSALAFAAAMYEAQVFWRGGVADLDVVRSAIKFEDPDRIVSFFLPSIALAQLLFWSDDYALARPALERVIRRLEERGELGDAAFLLMHAAFLEWSAGNPDRAERHRLAAEELVRDQSAPQLDLVLMHLASRFAAGRGELAVARALAEPAVGLAEQIGHPLFAAFPAMDIAWIELRTGQAAAAHDRLSAMRESFAAKGFGLLGSISLELWTTDIEALIACGRVDEAQTVLDELLGRAHRAENPNAIAIAERCRGLVLGARGQIAAAIDAMGLALIEHDRRPLAPEIARTLLELGTLQRRAKQKRAAKQTLDQALAMLVTMDARIWQARARDEIGRIGLRRSSVSGGLTPAQERVVELVVSGMSNREIASTLYMSVRSVESHLTKAYRELGVKSRSQLVAAMTTRHGNAQEPS